MPISSCLRLYVHDVHVRTLNVRKYRTYSSICFEVMKLSFYTDKNVDIENRSKTSDRNRFLTGKMAVEIKRNLSTLHILENWLLKTFTITLYNSASLCYHTAPYRFNCCQEADAIANCCCIICLRSVFVSMFFVYVRCYALVHQSTAVALPIYASYTSTSTSTSTYSMVFTLSLCLCYFKANDVF